MMPHLFVSPTFPLFSSSSSPPSSSFPSLLFFSPTAGTLSDFCRQSLTMLPPAHYNSFIFVIALLREALKHSNENGTSADQLVLVFCNSIMHTDRFLALAAREAVSNAAGVGAGPNTSRGGVRPAFSSHLSTSSTSSSTSLQSSPSYSSNSNAAIRENSAIVLKHFLTSNDFSRQR